MKVTKVWTTPDGDKLIAKLARVSNKANEDNRDTAPRLIDYLIRNKHWSPFEMVHACVEIETTRDIGRQILRHRSFSFQEFSQRYAEVPELLDKREVRTRDAKSRQNSHVTEDESLINWWDSLVSDFAETASSAYSEAVDRGVAPEVARAILPEGLAPTRLYMVGSLRSWIHYWDVRCHWTTQKEHRAVAEATRSVILSDFPELRKALENG